MHAYRHKTRLRLFDFYAATSHLIMSPGDFNLSSAFLSYPLDAFCLCMHTRRSGVLYRIAQSTHGTFTLMHRDEFPLFEELTNCP
jgi:hypothetical protein